MQTDAPSRAEANRPKDIAAVQTRFDATLAQDLQNVHGLTISRAERAVLRGLAARVAELAARPVEAQKRELWYRHNALEATRPVIFCDPENGWNEIIPPARLSCRGQLARFWEMRLRKEIFWGAEMGDDYTVQPCFDIFHVHAGGIEEWGLKETLVGGDAGGSYRWESPIKSIDDIQKLHFPDVQVDRAATERLAGLADEIFGGLLAVRVRTGWWWTLGMTMRAAFLRGLAQLMYDLVDNPDLVHRLMATLRDGTMALLDSLEAQDLLSLNNDGAYVGSGGLGWSHELPQPDFAGHVRCRDLWGFAESQETVGISPRMFAEFIFPYQLPILSRFGLNCYGCCEPLDSRWKVVEQVPNLRRVSISPWASIPVMAERLGGRYIFSLKPSPAVLAAPTIDEDGIRAGLRAAFQATRGCRVEAIMKDNHTLGHNPQNAVRWCAIAREEAERC